MTSSSDSIISRLESGPVKDWFSSTQHRTRSFENTVANFEAKGYVLSAEYGILLRAIVPEDVQEKIGHTLVDIVSSRPLDMHRHIDVHEYVSILSGSGIMFTGEKGMRVRKRIDPSKWTPTILKPGDQITIPRYLPHCFAPDNLTYGHLEIRLACSGILKDKCERQIAPFYEWPKELLKD